MEIEWKDLCDIDGDYSEARHGRWYLVAREASNGTWTANAERWNCDLDAVREYDIPAEKHAVYDFADRAAAKAACEQYVREREELAALRARVKELEAKLNPPKRVCGDRCDCWSCVSYR
jgi:hypothetical protein